MNMIYFLFQQDYAKVIGTNLNAVYSAILAVILQVAYLKESSLALRLRQYAMSC